MMEKASSSREKVLILTYFYPPCNLTAGQRIFGWAKYLFDSGYYPIIITRNWDLLAKNEKEMLMSSGSEVRIEKNEFSEVHYVPYKSGLRDRLYIRFGYTPFAFLSKIFTFFELVGQNFSNFFIPYSHIYDYSEQYLHSHTEVKKLLVTGNPFPMFRFGYLLNKKFKIKWIADYRDPWNSLDDKIKSDYLYRRILGKIETHSEKKWLSSSSFFTTISTYCVESISKLVNKSGHEIYNGYFEEDFDEEIIPLENAKKQFRIVYNGSLYPIQNIERFLEALKNIIDKYKSDVEILMQFPGLGYDKSQDTRIRSFMNGYMQYVYITERIPKNHVIKMQKEAHLLLILGLDVKGMTTSKIFEYVGAKRNILVCHSDKDVIEKISTETGLGIICDETEDTYEALDKLMQEFIATGQVRVKVNEEKRKQYSRRYQTKKLADLLDKL